MSKFLQGKLLGTGTYGEVYEGIDIETNEKAALKKIKLNENEGMPGTALREISVLKKLKHTNIINLYSVVHTENLLTLVFEYVDFELKHYITLNDHPVYLINQLISGVHYIHSMKIIHRDLKPQNILVNKNGILKIADFGLSRSMEIDVPPYSSEVVTLWYRSPELLLGETNYSYYVDIWSLGCIIYEILTKEPLFAGNSKEQMISLIGGTVGSKKSFTNELNCKLNVPPFLIKIVVECLDMNYRSRINADQVVRILEDEYKNY